MSAEAKNLKVTRSGERVSLSWETTSTTNLLGFLIEESVEGGPWIKLPLVGPTARSLSVIQPKAAKYRVWDEDKNGVTNTVEVSAAPVEPIEPPPVSTDIIWAADGEKAGPTNNVFLEWAAYSGAEYNQGNLHPRISLVEEGDKGELPAQGKYMYRFEMRPGKNEWDNERAEVLMEKQAQPGGPAVNSALEQSGIMEWKEGKEVWVAHDFLLPTLPIGKEVAWAEEKQGVVPIAQFHSQGSPPPPAGICVLGTSQGQTPEFWKTGSLPQWGSTDGSASLKITVKGGVRYRFLWHWIISADPSKGTCELWIAQGDGAPFQLAQAQKGKTLTSGFTYPCLGGPRNEIFPPSGNNEIPPTVVWYSGGMTFAKTRAAAEAAL